MRTYLYTNPCCSNESVKTILFIVGAGRSGSTLLDMVIGSNSKCFSLGEISRLNEQIRKNSLCGCGEVLQNCQFWRRIDNRLHKRLRASIYRSSEKFILNPYNELKGNNKIIYYFTILPFLMGFKKLNKNWIKNTKILYDEIFDETRAEVLVDSTKNIIRALLLKSNMKKMRYKFIYLVRDGRAVINSMQKKTYSVYIQKSDGKYIKRTYPGIYTSAVDAILSWKSSNLKLLFLLRLVSPRNRFFLRFEDLCNEPDKWIKKITTFLKIPFEDSMINFRTIKHHNVGGNPTRVGKCGIHRSSIEWNQNLCEKTLALFNKKAGFLNRYFNYR